MMIMVLLMYISLIGSSVRCKVSCSLLVLQPVMSPLCLFPYTVTELHLSIFHILFVVEPFWNFALFFSLSSSKTVTEK